MNEHATVALKHLESARGQLQAFQDGVWLAINHRDPQARAAGVHFYDDLDEKLASFDTLVAAIETVIDGYSTGSSNGNERPTAEMPRADHTAPTTHEPKIVDLDRTVAYSLDTQFKETKTWGFGYEGQRVTGVMQWQDLYPGFCQFIAQRYPQRFAALDGTIARRNGKSLIGRDSSVMTVPELIVDGIHVELNLDNDAKARMIKRILRGMYLDPADAKIYLSRGPKRLER